MEWLEEFWKSLLDEDHRQRLYLIGGAVAAVTVGGWKVYVHFSTKKDSFTAEKYEEGLKELEETLLKKRTASAPGSEQRALLEKELAALEQKRIHLEDSLQATQKVYAETVQLLEEKLAAQLPPDRIEQAKSAITEGDPALAETLLEEVVTSGMQQSAEASYQLGLLANNRVDYEKAWEALRLAAELAPANSHYLNETGIMARELGHYDAAIEYFEKSLDIDLNSLGSDHPNVAKTWNSLGLVWNDKGNTDKAREYFEKALASNMNILGSEHPSVAAAWNNLGLVRYTKGDTDKSIEYFEKALNSAQKTLDPNHPDVARTWNNLGSSWLAKGDTDKAIEYFEKTLDSVQKTLGPDHPNTARTYNNLGNTLYAKGNTNKAREYFEKALTIFRKAELEHMVRSVEENIRNLPPEE